MAIRRFVKKPVEVEAIKFTEETADDIVRWTTNPEDETTKFNWGSATIENDQKPITKIVWGQVYDDLHDTWVNVFNGQWVIKEVKGEFYPCDEEVLFATYSEIE